MIYEFAMDSFEPTLETGTHFFKPAARSSIVL